MHYTRHEQGTPEDQLRSAIARAEAETPANKTSTVMLQDIVYELHEPLVPGQHSNVDSQKTVAGSATYPDPYKQIGAALSALGIPE